MTAVTILLIVAFVLFIVAATPLPGHSIFISLGLAIATLAFIIQHWK